MSTTSRILVSAAALATLVAASSAQSPLLGISVGFYLPADSEIRDLVGKSFFQFGFSPGVGIQKEKFSIRPELSFLGGSGNGNRFNIIAVPITATMPLGQPGQKSMPYLAAGFGPTYYDYNITRTGPINFRDTGIGTIAHVEAGLVLGESMRLSARYNMLSEKDGFNFNGVQISLSWQFFRL